MSKSASLSSILEKTTALVDELTALMNTDTIEALPDVAKQFDATDVFNEAVRLLSGLISELPALMDTLKEKVEQLDAFTAMLATLGPLVNALGQMIGEGAEQIAEYGLDVFNTIDENVTKGFGYAAKALELSGTLSLDIDVWNDLTDSLRNLAQSVAELEIPPDEAGGEGEAA